MIKNRVVKISKEDNNFQHFEVIKRSRNKRHKHKEFFVEGVRNINEAVRNKWEISSFIYSGENELSGWAKSILSDVKVNFQYQLPNHLMDKLSRKTDTSELLAIVKMKTNDLSRIKQLKTH